MFTPKKDIKSVTWQMKMTPEQKKTFEDLAKVHKMKMAQLVQSLLELEFRYGILNQYKDKL